MARRAERDVCFGLCLGEGIASLSFFASLSLSLISTSEGKKLVVNSFGFGIWAFLCEIGGNHEDFCVRDSVFS